MLGYFKLRGGVYYMLFLCGTYLSSVGGGSILFDNIASFELGI